MTTTSVWLRWAFRTPRLLYDIGWGGLLGHRFLLLRHTGRRSGRPHAVLADYELRTPLAGPLLRRVLSALVGRPSRGTDADRRHAVTVLPLVALGPR